MFETAELGRKLSRRAYKQAEVALREELLGLQKELLELDHSQVVVVFAGVDGAGKGQTVSLLNEWMDPRWLITRAYDEPVDIELERPEFWRYWLTLPPRGRIGLYLSSWYSRPVLDAVYGERGFAELDLALERVCSFESALTADGAVILKFWMHLGREAQQQRVENREEDPLTGARVTERHRQNLEHYDQFIAAAERTIMRTNTGPAPWRIVEGTDPAYRAITVGTVLRDTLRRRLEEVRVQLRVTQALREKAAKEARKRQKQQEGNDGATVLPAAVDVTKVSDAHDERVGTARMLTVLSRLHMKRGLSKTGYAERLRVAQAELHVLQREARARGVSSLLVFEGPDAAGKGGAIRRINAALDPRNYQVHGVAAPTDEEKAQHYLWRFWRRLSRAGHISIFDRSWYGRVLVERVEGLATEDEWRRAYAEINDFEAQLTEHGVVLIKYWIHITKGEQLRRFKAREKTPYKRWKLTEEDWRNRARWDDYVCAVDDMVQFTSTQQAPWTLVEGNDKRYARVKVVETFTERLRAALGVDAAQAERAPSPKARPARRRRS